MHTVYILLLSNGKYYVGQTSNIAERLSRHNTGQVTSTKAFLPVELIDTEKFITRGESMRRERYLKSLKSHQALYAIIHSDDGPVV